jgi:hypothetical protein
MLNICGHKGNANPNNIEISPHSSQDGHHHKPKQQQMQARMWEKGTKLFLFSVKGPRLHCFQAFCKYNASTTYIFSLPQIPFFPSLHRKPQFFFTP